MILFDPDPHDIKNDIYVSSYEYIAIPVKYTRPILSNLNSLHKAANTNIIIQTKHMKWRSEFSIVTVTKSKVRVIND